MPDEDKTLFEPLLRASWKILKYSFIFFSDIFGGVWDPLSEIPHAQLFFCGFCLVIVPLVLNYWLLVLGTFLITQHY